MQSSVLLMNAPSTREQKNSIELTGLRGKERRDLDMYGALRRRRALARLLEGLLAPRNVLALWPCFALFRLTGKESCSSWLLELPQ